MYYAYDYRTGELLASESYSQYNGTIMNKATESNSNSNSNSRDCDRGLGFWGPREDVRTVNNRLMRVEEYTYCCKSILTTYKYKRPTVCNTPSEVRIAIREELQRKARQAH
jgi:hypothetical protein